MPLLPNHESAIIDPLKLRDYILSPTHPIGRFKAKFFQQAGYVQKSWQTLERDVREQHLSRDAKKGEFSAFGQKYEITAPLKGPNLVVIVVTSIWIILNGEDTPRLVTIIPGG